jgi:hypothetical protein
MSPESMILMEFATECDVELKKDIPGRYPDPVSGAPASKLASNVSAA